MSNSDPGSLVLLGEASQLKNDLNRGVASLKSAPESWFRPHICLNGKEGVAVIEQIAASPETANTMFIVSSHPIVYGDDLWINVHFRIFVDQISYPNHVVELTPRQTAHIVENLPLESRAFVLEKVKVWYFDSFRENILEGLHRIVAQFDEGSMLLKSDRENYVFDIHGGRSMEVPYTECGIAGANLFSALFRVTCLDRDEGGYNRLDAILARADRARHDTAEGVIGLVRALNA
ncbi:MAG: hypothetical protein WC790_00690 [Candidatus Paceibacterota bacterium]|jgi:hypothetical protein